MRLSNVAIASAPILFVLLWSTGFIGARFGLPYIEPMTFMAVRMSFVVALMAVIAIIGGARLPAAAGIGHSLITGLLVHGIYLGAVFLAISQGVPAGKKSLGLEITLTPLDRTLTEAEIEEVSAKVVAQVRKATGAELRG
jgi:drug/metabolite transporter (DMT)-like permease